MTNEEINRVIHEKVMGKCWHNQKFLPEDPGVWVCENPGCEMSFPEYHLWSTKSNRPDYCTDLNAVHRAEMKVVETKSRFAMIDGLYYTINRDGNLKHPSHHVSFATSRQRAEAVLRATGYWIDTKEEANA